MTLRTTRVLSFYTRAFLRAQIAAERGEEEAKLLERRAESEVGVCFCCCSFSAGSADEKFFCSFLNCFLRCVRTRVFIHFLICSQIVRLDRAEIEEMILTTHAEADQVRALSRVFLFMMFGALAYERISRARVSKASHLSFYSCSVTGRVCCKALTSIFSL